MSLRKFLAGNGQCLLTMIQDDHRPSSNWGRVSLSLVGGTWGQQTRDITRDPPEASRIICAVCTAVGNASAPAITKAYRVQGWRKPGTTGRLGAYICRSLVVWKRGDSRSLGALAQDPNERQVTKCNPNHPAVVRTNWHGNHHLIGASPLVSTRTNRLCRRGM